MRNKRQPKSRTTQKPDHQKVFDEAREILRESGDIDVVQIIAVTEENAKPTAIPFPYGGKGYNNWVSS